MMDDTSDDSYLKVEHLKPQTETQPTPKCPCTSKRVIFTTVLILSVSANAAFLLYFYRRHFKDATAADLSVQVPRSEIHRNTFCTKCTDIGVHPDMENISDLEDLMVQPTSDSHLCCLKNTEGRQMLLDLFTDQSNNASKSNQPDVDFVSSRKSGAHLYLNTDASKKSGSLEWIDESPSFGYTNESVVCDSTTLQIKRRGIYHIYSFLTLKSQHRRHHPDSVVHSMKRNNTNLPQLGSTYVIMTKQTLPEVSGRFVTSYLSATVRLRQGDHVTVLVSNISYVYQHLPSNFFGLYYVGE